MKSVKETICPACIAGRDLGDDSGTCTCPRDDDYCVYCSNSGVDPMTGRVCNNCAGMEGVVRNGGSLE